MTSDLLKSMGYQSLRLKVYKYWAESKCLANCPNLTCRMCLCRTFKWCLYHRMTSHLLISQMIYDSQQLNVFMMCCGCGYEVVAFFIKSFSILNKVCAGQFLISTSVLPLCVINFATCDRSFLLIFKCLPLVFWRSRDFWMGPMPF